MDSPPSGALRLRLSRKSVPYPNLQTTPACETYQTESGTSTYGYAGFTCGRGGGILTVRNAGTGCEMSRSGAEHAVLKP
ncbi:MAG: hypothetical protein LBP19_04420 [Treponema sp.]|nr:hypothetical protein [Treponema sp.]